MEARNRLITVPSRRIALGAAFIVAVVLLALALLTGTTRNPASSAATVRPLSTVHQQAPDAKDRNDAYSKVLSSNFDNQSPDAQERNLQLSAR